MHSINQSIKNLSLFAFLLLLASPLFAHFGPRAPLGGSVSCAISHNGIVYLGTPTGGVFETTNDQIIQWRPRPVGLFSGNITALTHSGNYLFAGTADAGVYLFNGFVGSDRYWIKSNSGLTNLNIKSLVAVDSISVLAGTDGGGLFKTSNKGTSWTAVNDALLNNAVITALAKAGNRIIATTLTGGVFASDNGGDTWMDFNDSNTQNVSGTVALSYNDTTDELLVLNSDGLFIATSASTTGSVAFTSADANLPANAEVRSLSNNGTAWFLATDDGVFVSETDAISWVAENSGLPSLDATAILALPTTAVTAIRDIGIYKSPTDTISWENNNVGFNNLATHIMLTAGDSLVINVTVTGVFVSKKLGTPATTFVRANTGLTDSLNVNDLVLAEHILLAATINGGVFSSSDTGRTWTAFNTGLSNLNITKLFYSNQKLYALNAAGNLFTSPLNAANWTALQNGLPNGAAITSMAFSGDKIILGTLGNGVFTKDYVATSWTVFNTGLSNLNVTSVTSSAGKFYAGTDGNGVFVTEATAANWTATAQTTIPHATMIGLDGSKIQAMASYAGYVYCSYKGGVLTTADEGATWEEAGNQFNIPSFTNVHRVSFVSSRVFALTENNGAYSGALSELATLANFLTVSEETLNAPIAGNASIITVTSNIAWNISTAESWLTASEVTGFRDGDFNIVASPNTGATRTGVITISSDSLSQPVTITVTQEGTTSITDIVDARNVKLFPNPGNGNFTLDFSAENTSVETVSLYDLAGKQLMHVQVDESQFVLPLSVNFSSGSYLVKLFTDKGIISKRLMIH